MMSLWNMLADQGSFMLSLLICAILYMIPLRKRCRWALKLGVGIPVCLAFSLLIPYGLLKYPLEVLAVCLCAWAVCDIPFMDALYCAVCAYVTQHFTHAFYLVVFQENVGPPDWKFSYLFSCVFTWVLFYFLFARKLPEHGRYHVEVRFSLVSTLVVMIFALILSEISGIYFRRDGSPLFYICKTYSMLCCFFIMWVQTSHRKILRVQREFDLQQQLWNQKKAQYELTKKNVDLINRKCHDLKHQISALKFAGEESREAYIAEMERSLQMYDSTVESGSEVLDTVLTEKSLYCEQHQISMTCVADGSRLSFMDAVDIYTIFGNALDNAIESVSREEDAQKRLICVSVWEKSGLLMVEIENYFAGELQLEDGLPITSKEDSINHGFGMKSIRDTVEKYDGCMGIYHSGDLFTLRISIPIP